MPSPVINYSILRKTLAVAESISSSLTAFLVIKFLLKHSMFIYKKKICSHEMITTFAEILQEMVTDLVYRDTDLPSSVMCLILGTNSPLLHQNPYTSNHSTVCLYIWKLLEASCRLLTTLHNSFPATWQLTQINYHSKLHSSHTLTAG